MRDLGENKHMVRTSLAIQHSVGVSRVSGVSITVDGLCNPESTGLIDFLEPPSAYAKCSHSVIPRLFSIFDSIIHSIRIDLWDIRCPKGIRRTIAHSEYMSVNSFVAKRARHHFVDRGDGSGQSPVVAKVFAGKNVE